MYRIETFALSCRATNAVTLTSVIAKLYTSYGSMPSCRDTIAFTGLIRRITRQQIMYSIWPRPMCYTVNKLPCLWQLLIVKTML